ncbi:MAG: hypothetical protein IJ071_12860 [Ruminococcus sp.]|nr:hypothetical protein [Ruminococcus sp.]
MLEAIMEGLIEAVGEFLLELLFFNKRIPMVLRLTLVSAIFLPIIGIMGILFTEAASTGGRVGFGLAALVIVMGYLALMRKVLASR